MSDLWKEYKLQIMTEIIKCSAQQYKPFRDALKATGKATLQENTGHPY